MFKLMTVICWFVKKNVIHYFLQCSGTNGFMDGVLPVRWVLQATCAEFVRGRSCPGGATSLMGWVMNTYNWGTVAYIIIKICELKDDT